MRQLVELKSNGAKQFEELGVEVVAVFREEKEGIGGLKKIKARTKVDFTLALDTPSKATMAYSNGRKEFDNYVIDKDGVIRGVIDGSLKSRAQAEQLVKMITSLSSESNGSGSKPPMDDRAAVDRAVLDYVEGIYEAKAELIERGVHPDLKMTGYKGSSMKDSSTMTYTKLVDFVSSDNAKMNMTKDGLKKVEIFSVDDNLASVKLKSNWGVDLLHLVKEDGKWKVLQIVTQKKGE